jgi:transposase
VLNAVGDEGVPVREIAEAIGRHLNLLARSIWLPAYAPDLNPVEGIWSVLKRGVLANLTVASFAHLVQVIRHGPKKIQYQPGLIEGASPEPG